MAKEAFEIPAEMRAFAEKSVEQARKAFDSYISAAQHAIDAAEGQATKARDGAKGVGDLAMQFAEKNIAASFEFAQKLVRAKDVEEVLKLQGEYVKAQMQTLADQAKELSQSAAKTAEKAS
jgi:phasin